RFRYAINVLEVLEARLKYDRDAGERHVLIATDGVFSIDVLIDNQKGVSDLADKYDSLVIDHHSHADGYVCQNRRGT
ncbi:glycine C-acetyltransferase, partial [Klebsiella quasipneumoniae]|nr:glycine C-acetyltransferase [Klebsiella quasipneumoniae]